MENEDEEGVWGYLVPMDSRGGEPLVLRSRSACPAPMDAKKDMKKRVPRDKYEKEEESFEKKKIKGLSSNGYLIGRHPECGRHQLEAVYLRLHRLI